MNRQAALADTVGRQEMNDTVEPGAFREMNDSVEPGAFREVMSSICTPVAIVTAMLADRPHATTVSAFLSLSVNPPMILVSLDRSSDLLACLRTTRRFGINLLAHDQGQLAVQFSRKGGDRFSGTRWLLRDGLPHLVGSAGWVACSVDRFVPGGDHLLVLGIVEALGSELTPPLTYHRRSFGTHAPVSIAADIAAGGRADPGEASACQRS